MLQEHQSNICACSTLRGAGSQPNDAAKLATHRNAQVTLSGDKPDLLDQAAQAIAGLSDIVARQGRGKIAHLVAVKCRELRMEPGRRLYRRGKLCLQLHASDFQGVEPGLQGRQGHAAGQRIDQSFQLRRHLTEFRNHAVREYLDVLDDAAFGAATPVVPKFISPADPASRWTGASGGRAFFAYCTNYLIDLKCAVILDVEATTAVRQAEVTAQNRMLDRVSQLSGVITLETERRR